MSQDAITTHTDSQALRDAASRLVDTIIQELPPGSPPEVIAITAMVTSANACQESLNGRPPQAGITVLANVSANIIRAMVEVMVRQPVFAQIPRELLALSLLEQLTDAQEHVLAHVLAQAGDVTRTRPAPSREAS